MEETKPKMEETKPKKPRRKRGRKNIPGNDWSLPKEWFHLPLPPDLPASFQQYMKEGNPDNGSDTSSIDEEAIPFRIPSRLSESDNGYRSDGNPPHQPPPIGVFWDIENCQVPRGKSALLVVQAVRERFFKGFREAEFVVVCDITKESTLIIQELNDAQVNLIHVPAVSKNAADEKLRQSMRRFADIHGFPAAMVVITGDINFATDLCDLRHRKSLHIILLHNSACSFALTLCANEHYNFDHFIMPIPPRNVSNDWRRQPSEVLVWNLPRVYPVGRLRERLRIISYNCGGRIMFISGGLATVRFMTFESALRARKRMNGEILFGSKIGVSFPQRVGTLNKDTQIGPNGEISNFYTNLQSSTNQNVQQSAGSYLQENSCNSPKPAAENSSILDKLRMNSHGNGSSTAGDTGSLPSEEGTVDGTQSLVKSNVQSTECKDNDSGSLKQNGVDLGTKPKEPQVRDFESPWLKTNLGSPVMNGVDSAENQTDEPLVRDLASPWLRNGTAKKSRTPPPYLIKPNKSVIAMPLPTGQIRKTFPNVDPEKFFNPIHSPFHSTQISPIELHVTNLDQTIEPMEMKKIVLSIFSEHVLVLHISVFMKSDGNFATSIKLRSIQDAQYAISQLHRKKIGHKRIMISYARSTQPCNQVIRWQVVTLLQDVPDFKLPLFKFFKLFESRYVSTISLSDIYKLKDVCVITEESTGRLITLNPEHRSTMSPSLSSPQDVEPYCSRHCTVNNNFSKGWAEQEMRPLPNVNVSLREFSSCVVHLVATHSNALPLYSFVDCYEAQCGPLNISKNGVPLEHLVTCVNKIELAIVNGVKYLKPSHSRNFLDDRVEDISKSVSPSLITQLTLFGRELVDLLRSQPYTQLTFNRLIPAYHHYFGRQCRVADYGFTKLIDLLEAIPNIAQVLGEGNKRIVTLSHRAQMRRFTSDLLKVLKAQQKKKITFEELPQAFERVFGKPFDPVEYGLCKLADLLDHVPNSTVNVCKGQITTTLSIPKREQSQDEIERTRQFSKEVIELLGHAPQCSLLFHQFVPAYHHHFGQQCRVAAFGFSKLIELFEAIPDIVKLEEDREGEKIVSLTPEKKLFVVGKQICDIVIPTYPPGLPLDNLSTSFCWKYGYVLKSQTYGMDTLEDLIKAVNTVRLETSEYGKVVVPVEEALVNQLMSQVRKYLIQSENGRMKLVDLVVNFSAFHALHLTPSSIIKNLPDAVRVITENDEEVVELTDVYQIGRCLVRILNANHGHMSLNALEATYAREGRGLAGYPNLASLLVLLPALVTLKGDSYKRHVILNKDLVLKKHSSVISKAVCRPSSTSFLPSQSSERREDSPVSRWTPSDSVPVINLPEMKTLPDSLLESALSMFSPCKGLLAPSARPPHPSQLPIPVYLSPKANKDCNGEKNSLCEKNEDKEVASNIAIKRKLRLAAQFQTPIDLN